MVLASSASCFSLAVEENSSHGGAEAILLRKLPGVEAISRLRGTDGATCFLLEEDEYVAVDADDRLRGLITHYFSTCIHIAV